MSSYRWQRIPVGGGGGLAALLRDDNKFYGWVTSRSGKVWMAWAPPDDVNTRPSINIMTDGKYIGTYNDIQNAMDVVRVKCLPDE